MKQFKYILPIVAFFGLVFTACVKEKQFPPEPRIEFVGYEKFSDDSADCIISFKDGDGDIGIVDDDTASDDDFKLKYLYKDTDGIFKCFDAIDSTPAMDTLFYSYRVPNITPEGQYKALEGTIRAKLRSAPLYYPIHTTVKFEIRLRDRAGNYSNIVQTNEFSTAP